jgi:chemotaxis signal transduction protein
MQALAFQAGSADFALRLADIERVEPAPPLESIRPLPFAPPGVLGLLRLDFRGRERLLPLVDLRLLLEGIDSELLVSTRTIVLGVAPPGATEPAYGFALLAERVLHLLPVNRLLPGFNIARSPYLGGFLDAERMPQLIEPQRLLPDALLQLYAGAAEALEPEIVQAGRDGDA